MSKEKLESMSCAELAKICKEKGIKFYNGKTRFKKAEMVEAIMKDYNEVEQVKADGSKDTETKGTDVKVAGDREERITNAEVGTLVAFRHPENVDRVISAKIVNRSVRRKMLKVETSYGAVISVPYNNVLWVKSGTRWPKFVYEAFGKRGKSDGKGNPDK